MWKNSYATKHIAQSVYTDTGAWTIELDTKNTTQFNTESVVWLV